MWTRARTRVKCSYACMSAAWVCKKQVLAKPTFADTRATKALRGVPHGESPVRQRHSMPCPSTRRASASHRQRRRLPKARPCSPDVNLLSAPCHRLGDWGGSVVKRLPCGAACMHGMRCAGTAASGAAGAATGRRLSPGVARARCAPRAGARGIPSHCVRAPFSGPTRCVGCSRREPWQPSSRTASTGRWSPRRLGNVSGPRRRGGGRSPKVKDLCGHVALRRSCDMRDASYVMI